MVLGIDVSKASFDVVLLADEQSKGIHKIFPDTPRGFKVLSDWLAKQGAEQLHACPESIKNFVKEERSGGKEEPSAAT